MTTMTRQDIQTALEEADMSLLLLDGFDGAFIGWTNRINEPDVACYDYNKMVTILTEQGMDYEEAVEYLDYNVLGAWVGDNTPFIVRSLV